MRYRIIMIGAGPGGLCMAMNLREAGENDFLLVDQGEVLGGTWYHNRYPGAGCDVPVHLYSYSFAPRPEWPRPYASQPEILQYLNECADRADLRPHLRFQTRIITLRWVEAASCWQLETSDGQLLQAQFLICATGMFTAPQFPAIEGLERFLGTMFHSARWPAGYDVSGQRVGIIGSAASTVQIVPEVADMVDHLTLFQRSANWIMPRDDAPFAEERLAAFRANPQQVTAYRDEIFQMMEEIITLSDPEVIRRASQAALTNLEIVEDPAVRAALTPTDPFGCKRPLVHNGFYPSFNRPHVDLLTQPIARIVPEGIMITDGCTHRCDTIVMATGFHTTRYISGMTVLGRGELSLVDARRDGPSAYLGIAMPGFPNLFMLYGPNSNGGSILHMIECQAQHIVRQVGRARTLNADWVEVGQAVHDAHVEEIDAALEGQALWQAGLCTNYYRVPSGRIVTQWPFTMRDYGARTARGDDAYSFGTTNDEAATASTTANG